MDKMNRMLAGYEPMALSIFRIMTGLLLFQYGVAKLFKYPALPMFEKVQLMSLYGAAGTIELIFGALLIVGLFPGWRPSSCPVKWHSPISSAIFRRASFRW